MALRIAPASLALASLALASPLLLLALLAGGRWGELLLAVLVAGFPVALIALGVGRRGGLGALGWVLALLLVLLLAGVLAPLLLAGRVVELPWLGGLPLAAALQLGLLFALPLPLVALAYALTFDRREVSPEELDRLRRQARRGG